LPVNRDGAVLFFQLIDARYEHASIVLMSNMGFEEWGDILGDEVMAAALIDRLHHCHVVNSQFAVQLLRPVTRVNATCFE
jgi:DNA replication protein DnaC